MHYVTSQRFVTMLITMGLALGSCGASPESVSESMVATEQAEVAEEAANKDAPGDADTASADPVQARPQLIKTANLALEVDSVDEAIAGLTQILKTQQGDILELSHQQPDSGGGQQFASVQVRVPQANLEATLERFSELGTVTSENISAQDVSDQLVDLGARLRNLQKAEESLLKILDRAGSMSDVLAVSKELRSVRQEIEQIDAQRTDLQNRVAYSTISVQIDAIATTYPTRNPLGQQLGQTWQASTRSLQDFSVGFLRFLLWLLVWSPYWGGVVVVIILSKKWRKKRKSTTQVES